MKSNTLYLLDKYTQSIAQMNNISQNNVSKQFNVAPSVQQKLEEQVQLSSGFLKLINIIPVQEQQGETIGLGVAGTIASTTDTSQHGRKTQDIHRLTARSYQCVKINYDTHVRYPTLDMWANFPDFARKIADIKAKRMALDRIMIAFNGEKHAKTSNRVEFPKLQDVAVGWLKQIENEAKERIMSEDASKTGKILIGKGHEYKNLDALVYACVNDMIDEAFQDDTELVAIMGRDILADKYFTLVNEHNQPTEKIASDIIISQKKVGGLKAMRVPFVPAGTILITRLDNLSIYYQESGLRRRVIDNPEYDRIEDFTSSNDAFVIEKMECVALIKNIEFHDVTTN